MSHVAILKEGFGYFDDVVRPTEILDNAKTDFPSHEFAQVNHYVVRSRAEFRDKQRRGNVARAGHASDKFSSRDEKFWIEHDTNHLKDFSIDRWVERGAVLRARMQSRLDSMGIESIAPGHSAPGTRYAANGVV